jgi:hypothetical protein
VTVKCLSTTRSSVAVLSCGMIVLGKYVHLKAVWLNLVMKLTYHMKLLVPSLPDSVECMAMSEL